MCLCLCWFLKVQGRDRARIKVASVGAWTYRKEAVKIKDRSKAGVKAGHVLVCLLVVTEVGKQCLFGASASE